MGFQAFAAEIIDGTPVGVTHTGQPHKGNILTEGLLYFAGGTDIAQIGIDRYLHHCARRKSTGAAAFVGAEYLGYIQTVYKRVFGTDDVSLRNQIGYIYREKTFLFGGLGFYC